jgi:hypothetical protein
MRLAGLVRCSVLGAVGFGVGGAIAILSTLGPIPLPFSVLVGGAFGGASLGLALNDWRKVAILALLGALGLAIGVFATLTVGSFFNYSTLPLGALVGVVVGASLGVAFLDWRTVLGLAVAGAVGFGVGLLAGDLLRASFPIIRGVGSIAVTGVIGGAFLGVALGYLERHRLAEEQRSRVR